MERWRKRCPTVLAKRTREKKKEGDKGKKKLSALIRSAGSCLVPVLFSTQKCGAYAFFFSPQSHEHELCFFGGEGVVILSSVKWLLRFVSTCKTVVFQFFFLPPLFFSLFVSLSRCFSLFERRRTYSCAKMADVSTPELTAEELRYYASLDLVDPDDAALERFLRHDTPSSSPLDVGVAAAAATDPQAPNTSTRLSSSSFSSSSSASSSAAATRIRPMSAAAAAGTSRVTSDEGGNNGGGGASTVQRSSCGGITNVLDRTDLVGGVAGMADAALQTHIVELPGRQLTSVASIQCFLNATHLYLQHNELRSVEGLELMPQLQVLVIHHNALSSVAPLRSLDRLFYLDVSWNQLGTLSALLEKELPCERLQYLSLQGNPCHGSITNHSDYVATVSAACPRLTYLDDVRLVSAAAADDDDDDEEKEEKEASDAEEGKKAANEKEAEETETSASTDAKRGNSAGGGGSSSRRVHEIVQAARAAARMEHDSSSEATEGNKTDAHEGQRSTSSMVSSSVTSKSAAPLEQEEERLMRQLLLLRTSDAAVSAASRKKDDSDTSAENARQLFQDLQYTQEVSQARQRRDIAAHWDDVSRVLQTAQGLQQARRRRMQERLSEDTPSYAATLQLLRQESHTEDLNSYRRARAPPTVPASASAATPKGEETHATAAAAKTKRASVTKKAETGQLRVPKPPLPKR